MGMGKVPTVSQASGMMVVHSIRASVYSIDEILEILEIPDKEIHEQDSQDH